MTTVYVVKGVTYAVQLVIISLCVYAYFWPSRTETDDVISLASEQPSDDSLDSQTLKYCDLQTLLQMLHEEQLSDDSLDLQLLEYGDWKTILQTL